MKSLRRKLGFATAATVAALCLSPLVATSAAGSGCEGPDANFYYVCVSGGDGLLEITTFANYNGWVAHEAVWGPTQQYSFYDEIEGEHYLYNTAETTCENLVVTHMMDWGTGVETLQQTPCS
ncbi:hypothetical protein OJ997_07200 [Solirubrobacter phytolaccae]|uniref:Secreted protein n=1 Tax=Solirubrobacter phytolaccae TaxID=1404360 RepID=A0A9X3SE56_9ACTN|nr:hypothetical protein [Solirubrobacter phytolaccae]MDA0180077.1 hypothetical protein [Solirubrobacter phytolaccae]